MSTSEIAQGILANNDQLSAFADANKMSLETARAVINRMLKEPEVSDEAKKYIWSSETSPDLKAFNAGEEKGYKSGHDAGFAKGVGLGALAVLVVLRLLKLRRLGG